MNDIEQLKVNDVDGDGVATDKLNDGAQRGQVNVVCFGDVPEQERDTERWQQEENI